MIWGGAKAGRFDRARMVLMTIFYYKMRIFAPDIIFLYLTYPVTDGLKYHLHSEIPSLSHNIAGTSINFEPI
jgi:hypothetical protein